MTIKMDFGKQKLIRVAIIRIIDGMKRQMKVCILLLEENVTAQTILAYLI